MRIGSKDVVLCKQSSFMGHEENVLPMLVYDSEGMGKPKHCLDPSFEFNDLANTGFHGNEQRFSFNKVLVFSHISDLMKTDEVNQILRSYGQRYAFFYEKSQQPLEDGYICRCRFVREDIIPKLYQHSLNNEELLQNSPAIDILYAFFEDRIISSLWEHLKGIYGDYYNSPYFCHRYDDEEQFGIGGAIWEEKDGIFRAWRRVIYIPK
jgi:hypothetical protein